MKTNMAPLHSWKVEGTERGEGRDGLMLAHAGLDVMQTKQTRND